MDENARVAFINASTAMMNAELQGMIAENQHRIACGNSIAYGVEAFEEVRSRYESVLGHNHLIKFLRGES